MNSPTFIAQPQNTGKIILGEKFDKLSSQFEGVTKFLYFLLK